MKNDSSYTQVNPILPETPQDYRSKGDEEPWPHVTKGPHAVLRFPVPVEQVGQRTVAIPVLPVDFVMFGDGFEHMVKEQLGQADGEEFIGNMVHLVSRKLMIAQIR